MGGRCHLPVPVSHLPPSLLAPIAGNFLTDLRHTELAQGHWLTKKRARGNSKALGTVVTNVCGFSGAETRHMNVESKKNQRLFTASPSSKMAT